MDHHSRMHAKLHCALNLLVAFVCTIGSSTKSSRRVESGPKREAALLAKSAPTLPHLDGAALEPINSTLLA